MATVLSTRRASARCGSAPSTTSQRSASFDAALFISHGVSFFTNYLRRREHLGTDLKTQMGEPYKRIIVMHLTIILGGFLTMLLRTPAAALLLLIALKTATDLYAHRKEHSRGRSGAYFARPKQ